MEVLNKNSSGSGQIIFQEWKADFQSTSEVFSNWLMAHKGMTKTTTQMTK